MPGKRRITKELIREAAVALVREQGADALNSRALAAKLGSSTQPIFTHYPSMEAVRWDVIDEANRLYLSYLEQEARRPDLPLYKSSGMGYIRFAREEQQLFRLLFMRDRSGEPPMGEGPEMQPLMQHLQQAFGISPEEARMFHLSMWAYVHGIASMIATNFLQLDEELISGLVSDHFSAHAAHLKQKEDHDERH